MATITRLYLSGVGVAVALCVAAIAFPEVPPMLMLGLLGGTFLALASRTHRYAQAQQAEGNTNVERTDPGREGEYRQRIRHGIRTVRSRIRFS